MAPIVLWGGGGIKEKGRAPCLSHHHQFHRPLSKHKGTVSHGRRGNQPESLGWHQLKKRAPFLFSALWMLFFLFFTWSHFSEFEQTNGDSLVRKASFPPLLFLSVLLSFPTSVVWPPVLKLEEEGEGREKMGQKEEKRPFIRRPPSR